MAAAPQPLGKPPTPPPAYTEFPDSHQAHPSTSTPRAPGAPPNPMAASPFPFAAPAHPGYGPIYGPTPIAQQAQLLPYYDPRSSYAVAAANSRARWRFVEAALWAVVILSVVSFVTGWEVQMMMARGVGAGHHHHRGSGVYASE